MLIIMKILEFVLVIFLVRSFFKLIVSALKKKYTTAPKAEPKLSRFDSKGRDISDADYTEIK